jgi:predicted amidohydrolase
MQDLTVTLIQTALIWEDIDANLAMLDAKIDTLDTPTDLIVLPEMFSTGFSMQAQRLAESMDGKAVTWLQGKAQSIQTALVGSLMIADGDFFYNRLVWAQPDGERITYDKKHLFSYAGEEKVYTAGDRIVTVDLKDWHIRPFICYDLRFPIWTRNLNQAYDLAIFVANWPAKRSAHWRALLKARAIENQAYVIGVNRVGSDGNGYDHSGDSAVITPLGETWFAANRKECHNRVTLSRSALDNYRTVFPAWMDADQDMIKTFNSNK